MNRKGIFKSFLDSIKIMKRPDDKLIGKDLYGNHYFEYQVLNKTKRYFKNYNDNWQNEMHPFWESWLRFRRKIPPTELEIQKDLQLQSSIKEKGRLLYPNSEKKTKNEENEETKKYPSYKDYD